MESLVMNFRATTHQLKVMDGREYLVASCVMITEGVHTGSRGALYYPANELQASVKNWDRKPVVVYHPSNPDAMQKSTVGFILNSRFVNGRLLAELWLDKATLSQVDSRVLRAVSTNQVMEVSTGLLVDDERTQGNFQGKSYVAIARNHKPHHLAILPDVKGACSVQDGCGLLLNSQGATMTNPNLQLATNQSKHLSLPTWNCACDDKKEETEQVANAQQEQTPAVKHLSLPKMTF